MIPAGWTRRACRVADQRAARIRNPDAYAREKARIARAQRERLRRRRAEAVAGGATC